MSEAVRYYTRDTNDSRDRRDIRVRKETSEDSGVESGHSIENNGKRETHDTTILACLNVTKVPVT